MATLTLGMSQSRGSTPTPAQPLGRSNLSRQFEGNIYEAPAANDTTPKSKARTTTVPELTKPSLSPSPAIRESPRRASQDDNAYTSATLHDPTTPQRPASHLRGLSLQMPNKQESDNTSNPATRVPVSPKLESTTANIYGSPSSVLPRRSRGLDFSRACTNLHHSTLAESSPDASPITGRGINIPQRRGFGSHGTVLDSPSQNPIWSSLHGEKTNLSSSVSSINMMDSDSDSDDSSEDMALDRDGEDPMLNTPAASRLNALAIANSPGMDWLNNKTQTSAHPSLLNFQSHRMSFRRARLRNNKSSHSSSSVSLRSSKPSPGPLSPPIRPSVENSGYFGMTKQQVRSRRESLSLGTDDLNLSDSEWESNNNTQSHYPHRESHSSADASSERGVIKRAVTRRSNLLPKTKGFARIRAALMEESDPLHSEARREAEVIKQVQDTDTAYSSTKPEDILGSVPATEPVEESVENATNDDSANPELAKEPFSTHAKRNSGGLGFWNTFDHTPPGSERYRTPPPPSLTTQDSAASDETAVSASNLERFESQMHGTSTSLFRQMHRSNSRSRSTTPLATGNGQNATQAEMARKVNNKRRRDDDLDPNSFKRRAVSPGMMANSAQSSPVVPQSPTLTHDKSWGKPPMKTVNDRSNSSSSATAGSGIMGPKRVGLQVMNEANDGFMSMSID